MRIKETSGSHSQSLAARAQELISQVEQKEFLFLQRNMVSFTVLIFYTENRKKFQLTQEKQGHILFTTLTIFCCSALLTWAMYGYLIDQLWTHLYHDFFNGDDLRKTIGLFVSKFLICAGIHVYIHPQWLVGLDSMKFIANHTEDFDFPVVAYMVPFWFLL